MKRTHMSTGVYEHGWFRVATGRRTRVKHTTVCGSVCDRTKATTEREKVTCRMCQRKIGATT